MNQDRLLSPEALLTRARQLLLSRVGELEARVRAGDEDAWPLYLAAVSTLSALVAETAPGQNGRLLSTRELAQRLGVSAKTVLKRKRAGEIRPAMQAGKRLIRWKGSEVLR